MQMAVGLFLELIMLLQKNQRNEKNFLTVDAIKMGAFDYISKPYKIDEIKVLVKKAGKHWNVIYSNEGKSD